jgi:hypothetical protein
MLFPLFVQIHHAGEIVQLFLNLIHNSYLSLICGMTISEMLYFWTCFANYSWHWLFILAHIAIHIMVVNCLTKLITIWTLQKIA